MRPRSATEWRLWWAAGGDRELRAILREEWPPLAGREEETVSAHATRLAMLLGSGSPERALAAELGRMRSELGATPDAATDAAVAERIRAWFPAGNLGGR